MTILCCGLHEVFLYSTLLDCSGVIDLVLILDVSGSIQLERYPMVLDFVASLLQDFSISPNATRVGAVYFSSSAYAAFYLDSYKEKKVIVFRETLRPQCDRTRVDRLQQIAT